MHSAAVDKSLRNRRDLGIAVVVGVLLAAAALRPVLQDLLDRPAVAHWATIFVAIAIQATPFLVLGVTVSAAIAAFVPSGLLPRRPSVSSGRSSGATSSSAVRAARTSTRAREGRSSSGQRSTTCCTRVGF